MGGRKKWSRKRENEVGRVGRGLRSVERVGKGRRDLSLGNVKVKRNIRRSQIKPETYFRYTAKFSGQSEGGNWQLLG